MEKKQEPSKPQLDATFEVASPNNPSSSGPSGTLDVPKISEESTALSVLSEGMEDQLLNSPSPNSSEALDDATEKLNKLKVVLPKLTTAQRREAIKAKLLAKGEAWDPAKWRRGKRRKSSQPSGDTPGSKEGPQADSRAAKRPRGATATPPSAEKPSKRARGRSAISDLEATPGTSPKMSYKDVCAFKIAIVPKDYPEDKLSADHGEAIEEEILNEVLKAGSAPTFGGTHLEKGALIVSCPDSDSRKWLEDTIPKILPFGEHRPLRAGLRKDILKSVRVFFRAHPKLLKRTPEEVIGMLDKQNPALNVKEWKVLPAKQDPKGYGFVCFLDEVCFKSLQSAQFRAGLGLWQVSFNSSTPKGDVKDAADQPSPQ